MAENAIDSGKIINDSYSSTDVRDVDFVKAKVLVPVIVLMVEHYVGHARPLIAFAD